jgi:uncharacterized membrane protein YbaN (DUF454 family)
MLINLGIGIGPTMYSLNHADPTTTILVFCKIRIYVLQSTSMMYRWSLAVASFDRYATSSANVRLRNFANVHIAHHVIALIVCIWLMLPIHAPIFYQLRVGGCGIFNNEVAALYHSIFTTVFGCILPVLTMTLFAILLYHNLSLKQQRLENNNHQQSENQNEVRRWQHKCDQQVLVMLLIQVFVYIISITPLMIMNMYNAITISAPNKSVDQITIEKFVFYIVEVIVYLFPVLSFYLYTMVSKIFREELKRLFQSIFSCKWNNTHRIEPTINNMPLKTVATHQLA